MTHRGSVGARIGRTRRHARRLRRFDAGASSTFIFTPCRQPWPGANVNARLPRRPLLDQFGQPLLDEKGKIRTISPTTWLIRTGQWSK